MGVKLAPRVNIPTHDANGDAYNGALLFTYQAGSTTKLATYKESTGSTAHANPIVLNSKGLPDDPIWLTEGQTYKFVLAPSTDTDPPASPIETCDNISGINDANLTIDQWVSSGLTPTYVSATQFTLSGDQTSEFQVGRRVKTTNSGGTVYGRISAASYSAPNTTVTVVNDSGSLDAGLSVVAYGILTPTNPSIPVAALPDGMTATTQSASDNSTKVATTAYADAAASAAVAAEHTGKFIDPLTDIADGTALTVLGYNSSGELAETTLPSRVIASGSPTATANLNFDFTSLDASQAATNLYLLRLYNVSPATDDMELRMTLSSDGGSTMTTAGYRYVLRGAIANSFTEANDSSTSSAHILVCGESGANKSVGSDTSESATVDILIANVNTGASVRPVIRMLNNAYWTAAGDICSQSGWGSQDTAADYDYIRLAWESGNWDAAGYYVLYKLAGA